MRRGTWKSTNFFNECTRCKKDIIVGNKYVARDWSNTGLPIGFWHKKCFELMNKEEEAELNKYLDEMEKRIEKKAKQEAKHQRDKNKSKTGYSETDQERADREQREYEEEQARLQTERENNFAETGYMELDSERQQREKKEERQQQKPLTINDMSTISLPCNLCGTVSCKNKNSCMVTSD